MTEAESDVSAQVCEAVAAQVSAPIEGTGIGNVVAFAMIGFANLLVILVIWCIYAKLKIDSMASEINELRANSNTPAVRPSRDRRLTRDIYDVFAQTRRDAMNSGPQTSSSREVEAFHVENHGRDSNTTNIKRR